MHDSIAKLAKQLRDLFLDPPRLWNEVSLFLCGGADKLQLDFRRELARKIAGLRSRYRYRVFLAEELFAELVGSQPRYNLLQLENHLAGSAHAVVILLESAGTLVELGAFANHPDLCNRLVVVVKPRFRSASSFVALGPLRYLRKQTQSKVIYARMGGGDKTEFAGKVDPPVRTPASERRRARRGAGAMLRSPGGHEPIRAVPGATARPERPRAA